VGRRQGGRFNRGKSLQADLPLIAAARHWAKVPEPEEAAKFALARRAKPGAPQDHVRLVLTLELQRALAEQLSARAIRWLPTPTVNSGSSDGRSRECAEKW